jgi:hypothetical protein
MLFPVLVDGASVRLSVPINSSWRKRLSSAIPSVPAKDEESGEGSWSENTKHAGFAKRPHLLLHSSQQFD